MISLVKLRISFTELLVGYLAKNPFGIPAQGIIPLIKNDLWRNVTTFSYTRYEVTVGRTIRI